jgi:probable rRNA maturation factor
MSAGARVLTNRRGRLGAYASAMERVAIVALRRAARRAGLGPAHELSLMLCDNPTIRAINRRWRDHDRPTDVLSFPLYSLRPGERAPKGPLGDVVVCLPIARRAARELGLPAERHLERLVVHGLAHLLGHDHATEAQARRMAREEARLLGRAIES